MTKCATSRSIFVGEYTRPVRKSLASAPPAISEGDDSRVVDIEWLSIRVTDIYPDRLRLPLLGRVRVTAVTVTARIRYLSDERTVTDTNYWVKVGDTWRGLWDPEAYAAYAKHRCPPT
jgi:hypothetical protein